MAVSLHRLARLDFDEAVDWYATEGGAKVAGHFIDDFEECLWQIGSNPLAFAAYSAFPDVRKLRLRRFPHLVLYTDRFGGWMVIAVMHGSRSPDAFTTRIQELE